jgi:hypothetical protein
MYEGKMKANSKLFWMGVVVLLLSSLAAAQSGTLRRDRLQMPGPLPPMDDLVSNATPVNFGGSFVITFNITVKSNLPSTDPITCLLEASTEDGASQTNPFGRPIVETAIAIGTRTSSTNANCKIVMYYNWSLITQPTDVINLQYTVSMSPAAGTTTVPALQRSTTQGLGSMPVPAAGTATTKTVPVTL